MRKVKLIFGLVVEVFILVLLVYFLIRSENAQFALIPFIICAAAAAGKTLGQLINKDGISRFFYYLYNAGFFLFVFGFLVVFCYIAVKQGDYIMLLVALPFGGVAIFNAIKTFRGKKIKKEGEEIQIPAQFRDPAPTSYHPPVPAQFRDPDPAPAHFHDSDADLFKDPPPFGD